MTRVFYTKTRVFCWLIIRHTLEIGSERSKNRIKIGSRFDASLLNQYEAGAKAVFDDAVQRAFDEQEEQAERDKESAARWVLQNGLSVLLERLSRPIRYEDDPEYHPGIHTVGNRRFETQRATALAELHPHAKRQMIKRVTIREAIVASLAPISKRTASKTDRRIEPETALRATSCG
jgi:hypothetical protein